MHKGKELAMALDDLHPTATLSVVGLITLGMTLSLSWPQFAHLQQEPFIIRTSQGLYDE